MIVGGGPAGLSGALLLGRSMRHTLVCDTGQYRNARSRALHGFLSRDGMAPADLLEEARAQVLRYETVRIAPIEVTRIHCLGPLQFSVATRQHGDFRCAAVLVATGTQDAIPDVEGMAACYGISVHVCPYCDGWEHRGGAIAILGNGEKAMRLAILMRQWTPDLVVCTDGPADMDRDCLAELRAGGVALREEKLVALESKMGCLTHLVFADGTRLARQALFLDTGQQTRSKLLEDAGCACGENGIVTDADGQTSLEGLFAAGDITKDVQLAVIAAAEGARAALAINRALARRSTASH